MIKTVTCKDDIEFPCFLFFSAPTCAPCQVVKKRIFALSKVFDDVKIYEINIQTSLHVSTLFGIKATPTCITLDKEENILRQVVGEKTEGIYESMMSIISVNKIKGTKRLLGF